MIHCLLLFTALVAGQVDKPAGEELKSDVRRLVRQLDAAQLAQREAAEAELLKRGPAILDLLPQPNDRQSAEVRQRLGRVRQKLQQQAADNAARSSTITLHADAMPLKKILAEFQRQSGNTIVDAREKSGRPVPDPTLKVNFAKTPFWQALDQVLDQAGLAVYVFGEKAAINVVPSAGRQAPHAKAASPIAGPFRFEPVSIEARRDLQLGEGVAPRERRNRLGAAAADHRTDAAHGRRQGGG